MSNNENRIVLMLALLAFTLFYSARHAHVTILADSNFLTARTALHAALPMSTNLALPNKNEGSIPLDSSNETCHRIHNKHTRYTAHKQSRNPVTNEHDWRKLYSRPLSYTRSKSVHSRQTEFYIRSRHGLGDEAL